MEWDLNHNTAGCIINYIKVLHTLFFLLPLKLNPIHMKTKMFDPHFVGKGPGPKYFFK